MSMLADDDVVSEIVLGRQGLGAGLAIGMAPGSIHISMSTISTRAASRLASEHAKHGKSYVAAPVFGNPDAAQARQLFVIAAGATADLDRCQPIFEVLSQQ